MVADSPGFPLASPRASRPFPRVPQPQGFESPVSPLLAPPRCRDEVARCSLGLYIPFRLLCVVPLTRPAPKSLPCASGSEEPSACCIVSSAPEGGSEAVRPGPCRLGIWCSKERRGACRCARWAPKSFAGAPVDSDAPDPIVSASAAPPKRGGLFGPVVRFRRSSEEAWLVRAEASPPLRPSEEGSGGGWNKRGWRCRPSEEGWRCRHSAWVRSPEGAWAHVKLPLVWRAVKGKPFAVRCSAGHRPSEDGRALCIAGIPLAEEPWLLRRSEAVRSACPLLAPKRWGSLNRCPPWTVRSRRSASVLPGAACRFHPARRLSGALLCRS